MHHALVYCAPSLSASAVPTSLHKQTADIQHVVVDRFSIANVRQLIRAAQQTAVGEDGRSFVVVAAQIPVEAQNALLKLFEEPPQGVTFHLVIPQEGMLIPTLRSRVQIVTTTPKTDTSEMFVEFLASSYADRLTFVADLAKNKEVAKIDELVREVEQYVHENVMHATKSAQALMLVREYIATPGASKKMLLEELALSLPTR